MTNATIVLAAVTALGVVGTGIWGLLRVVFKLGQVSETINETSKTLQQVTNTVANINDTMSDHELRIAKLEVK